MKSKGQKKKNYTQIGVYGVNLAVGKSFQIAKTFPKTTVTEDFLIETHGIPILTPVSSANFYQIPMPIAIHCDFCCIICLITYLSLLLLFYGSPDYFLSHSEKDLG